MKRAKTDAAGSSGAKAPKTELSMTDIEEANRNDEVCLAHLFFLI